MRESEKLYPIKRAFISVLDPNRICRRMSLVLGEAAPAIPPAPVLVPLHGALGGPGALAAFRTLAGRAGAPRGSHVR